MSVPKPREGKMKSRKAITNTQRRALRKWFFDPTTKDGPKTHNDASLWWQQAYGYYLNSSTVSEILSYKYDPLDNAASSDPAYCQTGTRKRQRPPKWETLEEELIKWVFMYESIAGEGSVSGAMLRERGAELWNTLECHRGMPMPKWSEGWQCRFKARYAHRKQKMLEEMARNCGMGGMTSPSDSSSEEHSDVGSSNGSTSTSTSISSISSTGSSSINMGGGGHHHGLGYIDYSVSTTAPYGNGGYHW
ncbi:mariner-Tc1 transposon family protein [Apiospora saccharicola]|uniref:Mariner-Tc1 transposon family protein n=1 Tax=Apiospora saccharicola TaxID=335842 RepID=A0ABR1TLH9_9PEZI